MRHEPFAIEQADQKYLYNGKELQDETEWLDYGFRMYDPALGRFHAIDPLADFKPGITPYTYADNNPVRYIDFYGLDKEDRIRRRSRRKSNKKPKEYKPAKGSKGRMGRKTKGNESGPIQGMGLAGVKSKAKKPYEEVVVEEHEVVIEDVSFDFGNVNLPDLKPIRIKNDPWDVDDFLTGQRTDLPTVFDNDHSYISRNQEQFNKWLKGIAAQLNQKGLMIQVTVFTAYEKGDKLDDFGYYSAPGVKQTGSATTLMNARARTIDQALRNAGVKNALKTQKQYETGGKQNHTILIQIF